MMGTLSSERAQETLRARAKDKARSTEDSLRSVLNTKEGRAVFRWLLSSNVTGLTSSAFYADSNRTAWAEGRRSVGVEVLTALEHVTPGAYAMLVAEGAIESREDKIHSNQAEAQASEEANE